MTQMRTKLRISRTFRHLRLISWLNVFILIIGMVTMPFSLSHTVSALVQNPTPAAQISFTFDDGLASTYTQATPILAKDGLIGTEYIPTSCIGSQGTCPENTGASYMTWPQVQALQNNYGWEIGSHSVDTPCMASSAQTDPDDCPNQQPLTTAQIDAELANSKSTLASYGLSATSFAPPYGDFSNNVLAQIAKYYTSMKQFKNASNNPNDWPYSDYYLQDYPVLETTTPVSTVEAAINNAITNHQWLILTFHDILTTPSSNPDDDQYGVNELAQIAAYVQAKQAAGLIKSTTISKGLVASDTNMMPNSSFDSGIGGGWTTDAPTTITWDKSNNGSSPSPTNAIKLVAQTANRHLFSPQISVDPATTYLIKNFLNVSKISSGIIGFYIDEYDVNGHWLSGQYKNGESNAFVEDYNFNYKPTSVAVRKASLQIIVAGGSAATAYLDNVQWFPLSTQAPSTPNLLPNQAFNDGIADGWTTDDSTDITPDTGGHGSPANPVNSVSLKSTTKNVHLFSPKIAVDSTKTYTLTNYVDLRSVTNGGEVGFYIDEYDSNGNWTSGQYITGVRSVSTGDVAFNYKPTSSNVKTAGLQVIASANAGINAYFDNARWYVNQ